MLLVVLHVSRVTLFQQRLPVYTIVANKKDYEDYMANDPNQEKNEREHWEAFGFLLTKKMDHFVSRVTCRIDKHSSAILSHNKCNLMMLLFIYNKFYSKLQHNKKNTVLLCESRGKSYS
jgi:hypothetical protein